MEFIDSIRAGFVDEIMKIAGEKIPTGSIKKFMTEGRSKGKRPPGASDKEVKKGVRIEMEHTTDPAVAKKITFDHLKEFKKYNTNLKQMERRMEGEERGKTAQWQYAPRA